MNFFLNYRLQKQELLKRANGPVSEYLWRVNMLKGPKDKQSEYANMHGRIFLSFFDHSERKSAEKILF